MIHHLSDVQTKNIGENTVIWQYSVVLSGAKIGGNCNINCHTFIENDVEIGDNVTIKSGVYLWDGIKCSNNVFIGPNATFVNNKTPRSKQFPEKHIGCIIGEGASVGANATIMGQISIGEFAMIAAGSVVTRNVKPYELVVGNPARHRAWLDEFGKKLNHLGGDLYESESGKKFVLMDGFIKVKE